MIIRNVSQGDWEAICRIELENFTAEEASSKEYLQDLVNKCPDTFLVAEIEGELAGYVVGPALSQRYLTDNLFHEVGKNAEQEGFIILTSLSISKTFQGQGIGTALLATLKDLAVAQNRKGISLTCHDYLISYYEVNGFTDEGESESNHGGATWYNLVWENPYFQ